MKDQRSGMRFDIYERVHLPDEVMAIQELDEIELTPHIQVLLQGDQALLRGNLLLQGKYVSAADRRSIEELQHFIPVEITLPMNRVSRLEDIAVEIENFDIDLLSSRSLNVTGVLTLHGIGVVSNPVETWRDEDEVVFVHQAADPTADPSDEIFLQELVRQELDHEWETGDDVQQQQPVTAMDTRVSEQEENAEESFGDITDLMQKNNTGEMKVSLGVVRETEEPRGNKDLRSLLPQEKSRPATPPDDAFEEEIILAPQQSDKVRGFTIPASETREQHDATPKTEAVEEVEVAESADEDRDENVNVNVEASITEIDDEPSETFVAPIVSAVEHDEPTHMPIVQAAPPATNYSVQPAPAAANKEPEKQGIEWKKLFLSGKVDQHSFSRVRVCIVQKEESIDDIAQRYSMNPREIVLYNRLSDHSVKEGQVIYIPG